MKTVTITCDVCEQTLTEQNAVITPHRVVGPEVDVTGGPNEVYCPNCAAERIYDLREHLSNAYRADSLKAESKKTNRAVRAAIAKNRRKSDVALRASGKTHQLISF
jgi:hypothetical protein